MSEWCIQMFIFSLEWTTVRGSCNATINHVGVKTMILLEGGQQIDERVVECSHLENEGGLFLFIKVLPLS